MWAVIPVKNSLEAKQRLASSLNVEQRQALCLAMLSDVLRALDASKFISQIVIISQSPVEFFESITTEVHFLQESACCHNLNQAINEAVDFVEQQKNNEPILVLHGDLPLLNASILDRYLNAFLNSEKDMYLFGDKTHKGTNALVFNAHYRPPFLFGEHSQSLHLIAFAEQKKSVELINDPMIAFDIDEFEDLQQLFHSEYLAETTQTFQLLPSLKYSNTSEVLYDHETGRCG